MVRGRYRLFYSDIRPSWELRRQTNGKVPVGDYKPRRGLQFPDRADLARLLCDQPDSLNPEEPHRWRNDASTSIARLGR